ncbi:MAG: ABC transporter ATP-binding protein [Armatimonadota bacterium]
MSKPIIEIENIGKKYRIGANKERYLSLRDEISNFVSPAARRARAAKGEFWALKNVSFSVKEGEAVGIIGRNGAGKSTLLKVLSQITPPTEGKIKLRGRIASLLEVGTGFHPELTGRENIYLNGAILGMTRREIARKFDEIVAFAEVEKFLDTPVKRYSSGMYVRLAFAVAAHLEPEILVVDEVLAVGDAEFQKKCLGKMGDVAKSGRTVLFVSHNMGAISELCPTCVHLSKGQVHSTGCSKDVIAGYLESNQSSGRIDLTAFDADRTGDGPMRVTSLATSDAQGRIKASFDYGEPIMFEVEVDGAKGRNITLAVTVRNNLGNIVIQFNSANDTDGLKLPSDLSKIGILLPDNILVDGKYYVTVWLGDGMNILNDRAGDCLSFAVESSSQKQGRVFGCVRVGAEWTVEPSPAAADT